MSSVPHCLMLIFGEARPKLAFLAAVADAGGQVDITYVQHNTSYMGAQA